MPHSGPPGSRELCWPARRCVTVFTSHARCRCSRVWSCVLFAIARPADVISSQFARISPLAGISFRAAVRLLLAIAVSAVLAFRDSRGLARARCTVVRWISGFSRKHAIFAELRWDFRQFHFRVPNATFTRFTRVNARRRSRNLIIDGDSDTTNKYSQGEANNRGDSAIAATADKQ